MVGIVFLLAMLFFYWRDCVRWDYSTKEYEMQHIGVLCFLSFVALLIELFIKIIELIFT